jgi:hypothetical protein
VFLDDWIVAIGVAVVAGSGLLYLLVARPDRHSDGVPEGDAIEVAAHLRQIRASAASAVPDPRSPNAAAPREEIR